MTFFIKTSGLYSLYSHYQYSTIQCWNFIQKTNYKIKKKKICSCRVFIGSRWMKQCFARMGTSLPIKKKRCGGAGFKTVIDVRCLYSLLWSENGSFNKRSSDRGFTSKRHTTSHEYFSTIFHILHEFDGRPTRWNLQQAYFFTNFDVYYNNW